MCIRDRRITIDPHDTFEQLLSKVQTRIFQSQPHAHLPYQCIIDQLPMKRHNERNMIQTMFTFDEYPISTSRLDPKHIIQSYSIGDLNDSMEHTGVPRVAPVMFEMELSMEHRVETESLRVNMMVSSDLFHSTTLIKIGRQFQLLVEQLFPSTSAVVPPKMSSICDLSILLMEDIDMHIRPCLLDRDSKTNSNAGPFQYQVTQGFLSIDRLRTALRLLSLKCRPLHRGSTHGTADRNDSIALVQNPWPTHVNIEINRCGDPIMHVHIFQQSSNHQNTNLLEEGDTLIFHFHPHYLDCSSIATFFTDLSEVYEYQTSFVADDLAFGSIHSKLPEWFSYTSIFND